MVDLNFLFLFQVLLSSFFLFLVFRLTVFSESFMIPEYRVNVDSSSKTLSRLRVISIEWVLQDLRVEPVSMDNPEMLNMSVPFSLVGIETICQGKSSSIEVVSEQSMGTIVSSVFSENRENESSSGQLENGSPGNSCE